MRKPKPELSQGGSVNQLDIPTQDFILQHRSDWLQTTSELGNLHGIVQSDDGYILIQNACENSAQSCILRCDIDGKVISTFKSDALAFPHGLELYKHPVHGSCLLHTDNKKGVSLFKEDGTKLWHIEKADFYKLHWTINWSPSNCAIASDGRIYLADGYGSFFICVFDADGNDLGTFGGARNDESGIVHPHGCAIVNYNGQEVLAVTECQLSSQDPELLKKYDAHSCIKLLSLDGQFIERIVIDTISPRHIRTFGNDHYIIPDFQGRILITDHSFNVVKTIGKEDSRFEKSRCDVTLDIPRPHDCCIIEDDLILVTDFTGLVHSIQLSI